ncbi:MAG: flippase-like domain-containing protein [Bacteroidales bacterium]|nr:flippase-like domain-containing protein [Bacteroidales bacterium]
MKTKLLFNILLYLSLIFLVVYLYRLNVDEVKGLDVNVLYLLVSLLFLWGGFYLSTLSWWYVLKKHNINISKRTSLKSHGLSVFAKYIPGKIWVVLGRAAKATEQKYSVKTASFASLKEQLLYVWLGLLISALPLFLYRGIDIFSISVSVLFVGISFINFSDKFRIFVIWSLKKVLKKDIEIPHISFKKNLKLLVYIFIYWTSWIIAFYFLSLSLYPDTTVQIGFIFPLSVTIGLLAVIVPGGIGVREGIMVTFMVLSGMPVEIAVSISVVSRIWYISGELFIFLSAVFVKKSN